MVGLDCSILMNPKVWVASGHVGGFSDPMVDCKKCKRRYRADKVQIVGLFEGDSASSAAAPGGEASAAAMGPAHAPILTLAYEADDATEAKKLLAEDLPKIRKKNKLPEVLSELVYDAKDAPGHWSRPCPAKGCDGELTEPRSFNLMFKTHVGALEDSSSIAYLRPETAQGIFVNFKNVCDTGRARVPMGIAQVGKAFRNEINPRNFTFRSREFEQMEIEFFCHPSQADGWYQYWRNRRFQWYIDLGLKSEKLRLRDHRADELAHYAKGCADVEYEFPFGVSELEGIANRTDFDLRQHMEHSGKDLQYFDDQVQDKDARRYVPYVIEPSAGADRATLAFLCEAYVEDVIDNEPRTLMRFHPRLAPIKAAIFPLVKKDGMPEKAEAITKSLRKHFPVFYDEKGAIGRRYRRQDEIGTPYCITVDNQTLVDDTVTIRDRDSTKQERIAVRELLPFLLEKILG
jgi:glycyl-tRNA synthetase